MSAADDCSESSNTSREDLEYLRMSASELNNFGVKLFEIGDTELSLKFYTEALQAMMIVIPGKDTSHVNHEDLDVPGMKKRFQMLLMRGNKHIQTLRGRKKKNLGWSNPVDMYPLISSNYGAIASVTAIKVTVPHTSTRKSRKKTWLELSKNLKMIQSIQSGNEVTPELGGSSGDKNPLKCLSNEIMKMKMTGDSEKSDHSEVKSLLSPDRWSPMTCLPFGPMRMSSGLLDVPLGEVELITRNNISIVVDNPSPKLSGKNSRESFEEKEWQDRDTNLVCTLTTHRIIFNLVQGKASTMTTRQIPLRNVKEATAQGGTILFVHTQCKITISTVNFGDLQIWFPTENKHVKSNRNRDEMLSWLRKCLSKKAWNTMDPHSAMRKDAKVQVNDNSSIVTSKATSTNAVDKPKVSFAQDDGNLTEKSDSPFKKKSTEGTNRWSALRAVVKDVAKDAQKEEQAINRWTEMLHQANQIKQWMKEIPVRCDCARILYNMGIIYVINGFPETAQKLFETSMSIVRQDDEGFPYGATVFPSCINNIALTEKDDDKALDTLFEALRLARLCLEQYDSPAFQTVVAKKEIREYHKCIAMVLSNIGRIYFRNQKYVQSLELCREALSERRKAYEDDQHNDVLITLCNIGFNYEKLGDMDEALFIYKSFLDYPLTSKNDAIQNEHFDVLLHYLSIRCRNSDFGSSNINLRKALEKVKIKSKSHDLHALSRILYRVAIILSELNEKMYALPFFIEQLTVERYLHGRDQPRLASILNNIGQIYHNLTLTDIALSYYQEALHVIVEQQPGDDSSYMIGLILHNVGSIHFQQGLNDKAMGVFNRALTLQKKNLGDDHPDIAVLLQMFGIIKMQQQNEGEDGSGGVDHSSTIIDENVKENFKAASTKFEYNFGVNGNAQSMYRIGTMSTWYHK